MSGSVLMFVVSDPGERIRDMRIATNARSSESESASRRIRTALETPAILAALALLVFFEARHSRIGADWGLLAVGLSYANHVILDAQRGRTNPAPRSSDPKYDYVRSADPVGFWVLISLKAALATAAVLVSLGQLIGLWQFWS